MVPNLSWGMSGSISHGMWFTSAPNAHLGFATKMPHGWALQGTAQMCCASSTAVDFDHRAFVTLLLLQIHDLHIQLHNFIWCHDPQIKKLWQKAPTIWFPHPGRGIADWLASHDVSAMLCWFMAARALCSRTVEYLVISIWHRRNPRLIE